MRSLCSPAWLDCCYDMGAHMKTTVEIADGLLADAKKAAARRGVTLRTVIEEGLRLVVKSEGTRRAFRLREASVGGQGVDPAFGDGRWDRVRDAIYKGRGA